MTLRTAIPLLAAGLLVGCGDSASDASSSGASEGSCTSIPYLTGCGSSLFCGGRACCDPSTPYYCPGTQTCYGTAAAASSACGGGYCVACAGDPGGGNGGGGTCATASAGSCSQSGQRYCGSSTCCPSSSPYYCPSTRLCYGTAAAASTACGGSTCSACVTPTSGGGTTCHNYSACLRYQWERGTMCASSTSVYFRATNTCSYPVLEHTCLERRNGTVYCGSWKLAPGETMGGVWVCDGTGRYLYWGIDPADPTPACGGFAKCPDGASYSSCL